MRRAGCRSAIDPSCVERIGPRGDGYLGPKAGPGVGHDPVRLRVRHVEAAERERQQAPVCRAGAVLVGGREESGGVGREQVRPAARGPFERVRGPVADARVGVSEAVDDDGEQVGVVRNRRGDGGRRADDAQRAVPEAEQDRVHQR